MKEKRPTDVEPASIDERCVFSFGARGAGQPPVILIGVPRAAYERIKDGKTIHFSLAGVGVPIEVILFGAATHAAALTVIEGAAKESGAILDDRRRQDFGIKT